MKNDEQIGWARRRSGVKRILGLWGGLALLLAMPALVRAQSPLTNGGQHVGEISPAGDTDSWTLSLGAGSTLLVRVGATNFTPRIRVFDPANGLAAETTTGNSFARDGQLSVVATNAGTYSVLVNASFAGQTGGYGLHVAALPGDFVVPAGDEGGELANGAAADSQLTLGDMDLWRFTAGAGDGLMIRMGSGSVTPWLRLYGPGGELVAATTTGNSFARDGVLTLVATNAGTYTVVASAVYSGQIGSYTIHRAGFPGDFVVSPEDQGGELRNGFTHAGEIEVGDLDLWQFAANAGDGLMVRMGATNSLTPWVRVYGPDGGLVDETTSGNAFARDGVVTWRAAATGTYRVVVSATYSGQAGTYGLRLARAPADVFVGEGDEGGDLANGEARQGTIPVGDLDVWRFNATAGSGLMLRVGAEGFTPWIRLYGPDGALVDETTSGNSFARDGVLTLTTTNAGPYTAVVGATFSGQTGTYTVSRILSPGEFVVTDGDDGGALINAVTNNATLSVGDLDIWSFVGTPGDSNVLRVAATSFTPWIRLYHPNGSLIRETTSGNSFARVGSVSLMITNEGIYTVVVSATFSGQLGPYTFRQSRVPPDLILPALHVIDEGSPVTLGMSAQDPDEPVKPLVFGLLSGPPGMTVTGVGATNATLAWATDELTGPSTNLVLATVTDVVNGRPFTRTNLLTVVVNEINTAPVLTVPADQTIDEGTALRVSATATDADQPANALAFQLLDAPAGMTIDPATGAIAWDTTEATGPSTHLIRVVVTDDNPWAVNAKQISVTNAFTVVVRELNTAPTLVGPGDHVIDENTPLAVSVVAGDVDLPANPLSLRLIGAPAGMTLDPATGAIAWLPGEAQGPSTNLVAVVVSDESPQAANAVSLSVTNPFTVVVREINQAPVVTMPANPTLRELTELVLTVGATDADLPPNPITFRLESAPAGMTIDASTGVLRWTPTEAQGPSTNLISVIVTDRNPWASVNGEVSVTNQLRVVVTEENLAPVLDPLADVSIHYGLPLTFRAVARDDDLPANRLEFVLEGAPEGMAIDPADGTVSWTPPQSAVGIHPVTVVVRDNGDPVRQASQVVRVTVVGAGAQLEIGLLGGGLVQVRSTGEANRDYELQVSEDLAAWRRLVEFRMTTEPNLYIDPGSATASVRFYRLMLKP